MTEPIVLDQKRFGDVKEFLQPIERFVSVPVPVVSSEDLTNDAPSIHEASGSGNLNDPT